MDNGVVIFEHVDLVNILELLHTCMLKRWLNESVMALIEKQIKSKYHPKIVESVRTEFLNGLFEFFVFIDFLVMYNLLVPSLRS